MAGLLNRLYEILSGSRSGRSTTARKTIGRRRLKMEMLENRFPLDATLTGVVFNDLNGDSIQLGAGEVGIGGVTLQLFNDVNNNQTYEAGIDTFVGSTTSSAVLGSVGNYSFNVPAVGNYLVRQTPTPGFAQLSTQRTQAFEITALEFATTTLVTTVDTFNEQAQLISVLTTNPISDSAADVGILGGERDLTASRTSGSGDFQIAVDQGDNNLLRISTDGNTTGVARIIYDGIGGTDVDVSLADGTFAPAVDLTSGGTAVGMRVDMRVDANGASAEIILRSAGGTSTTGQIAIPQVGSAVPVFFSFGTGVNPFAGTADLTAITSIELVIRSNPDADIDIDQVGTYRPFNESISLANVPSMTIGNQVFADRNNNGIFDNTGGAPEVGISGITVQLFADTNGNGTFESGTDLPALDSSGNPITTTTNGTGLYTFTDLAPGPYFVVIPSSQVGPNFVVSSTTPAGTNDVNRGVAAAVGVVTSLITLVAGAAPTTDGDSDVSTDLSADIGLVPQFDLTVTKTSTSTVAVTGSTITYTVTARNDGPAAVSGVGILDNIPDGLRIISVTPVGSDVITIPASASDTNPLNPDDISITIGTLAPSAVAQRTYTIVAEVLPITTGTGTPAPLVNTVEISGLGTELQVLTNTATVTLPVQLSNDLVALKTITTNPASTGTPAIAAPGTTITYTITGRNDGPSRATAVRILDNIPDGLQILTATSSDVTDIVTIPPSALDTNAANPDDITIVMGDLLVGAGNQTTITITAVVLATTSGLFTNSATISSTDTAVNSEINAVNNQAEVQANAQRSIDLVAVKSITTNPASTATPAVATPGSTITYTILARNDGPFAATTVQVVDDIPDGIQVLSATLNGTAVTVPASASDTTPANPDNITFAIGDLATGAGNQSTISIVALVLPGTLGQFTNTAVISATDTVANFEATNVLANNTSAITANAVRTVNLGVTKNAPLTAISGNTITYTMNVTNNGPSDAIGVQVVDNIPDGIRIISATVNGVSATIPASASDNIAANNDDITFLVGNLAASAVNNTITIVAAILPETTGALVNSAVASTTDTASVDPINTNNSSTVTTTLSQQNDVTVSKVGPATAAAGSTITYTLNVTNNGPSTATSVSVADTLPAGVTFISGTSLIGTTVAGTVTPGANNTANVTVPTLAPGQVAVVTIVANVGVTNLGIVTNSVTVTATNDTVANNTATATTNITAPSAVVVTGRIYIDSNVNNVADTGEAGVAGVTVTLTGTRTGSTTPITPLTTTTNANGEYFFANVEAGTYTVTSNEPRGSLAFQAANPGTTGGTAGTQTANPRTISAITIAGVNSNANNVGFTRPFSKRSFLASTPNP